MTLWPIAYNRRRVKKTIKLAPSILNGDYGRLADEPESHPRKGHPDLADRKVHSEMRFGVDLPPGPDHRRASDGS